MSKPDIPYGQVVAAMSRPGFYPHPVENLTHLQTHISHIFLTGPFAYKLKKPMDLGFLDFRSLESRRRFTEEELRLNRRLAPEIYLQVLPVAATDRGPALAPGGESGGDVLDYVLQMAQMDSERMMDRMLRRGEVTEEHVRQLARVLAGFYREADRGPEIDFSGRLEQVRINVEENFRQTEASEGVTVAPARWQAVADYSLGFLADNRELFEQRVAGGHMVDGHGDLHSGNINLPRQGRPLIFDCIEFNERFRQQDAACDLAFLAMDLDFHGCRDLSDVLVSEYIEQSGDQGLREVLTFYKCYRAVVRAKVFGFMYQDPEVETGERFRDLDLARAYWRLAAAYAGSEPPYYLVCLMGRMGTGKSHLARALSRDSGWPHLSSDELRKQQAGLAPEERSYDAWGQGLYGPETTQATYQRLWEAAREQTAMGASVVVDASFREDLWRRRFLDLAAETGAGILFVEVTASPEVVIKRLTQREKAGSDASDGRRELLAAQAAAWQEPSSLVAENMINLDGADAVGENVAMVMARLKEMGLEQTDGKG